LQADLAAEVERLSTLAEARSRELEDSRREVNRLRAELSGSQATAKDSEASFLRTKDALERQLAVQQKYAQSNEATAQSYSKKIAELEALISTLTTEREEARNVAQADLEQATKEADETHHREEEQLQAQIASLRQELEAVKSVRPLGSPFASPGRLDGLTGSASATAIELLRVAASMSGTAEAAQLPLTATALYARAQEAEEALTVEKATSSELRACLNQVLTELEAKAPIIQQQQRDYERALASHEELARRLNSALRDSGETAGNLRTERALRVKAEAHVETLQGEVTDLSQQVQTLLRHQLLHPNQAGMFSQKHSPAATSTMPKWSGSDEELVTVLITATPAGMEEIVEEHMLTFDDLEQLQRRNQQLVRVVRTLSKQLAQAGGVLGVSGANGTETSAAQTLGAMMAEVSQLRADREKHAAMVATLSQQRDMYRVLLQQADSTLVDRVHQTAGASPAGGGEGEFKRSGRTPNHTERESSQAAARLDEFRAEVERLREELKAQGVQAEQIASALRDELTTARVQLASAVADSKLHLSRAESLRSAEEAARMEVQRAHARSAELQSLLVKHEREISSREATISAQREELSSLKSQLAHANAEKEVLTAAEVRNMQALKDALEDRDRFARLAESMRSLEATLSVRESSERQQLVEDRARLQNEWMAARQALDDESALNLQRAHAHAGELREAARRHDELSGELSAARAEVVSIRGEAESLRVQLLNLNEQLAAAQLRVEGRVIALGTRGDVDANRLTAIELQLRTVSTDLDNAKEMLASKEKHLHEYKAIAQAAEDNLKELKEAAEKWRLEALGATETARKDVESLRKQVESLSASLQAEHSKYLAATTAAFQVEDTLRTQLSAAVVETQGLQAKLAAAAEREEQLQKDVESIDAARRATQQNYDMQLQMHSADSKTLTAIQDRVKVLEDNVRLAREEASRAAAALFTGQQTWNLKEQALQKQLTDVSKECTQIKNQNALLHSQLQTVTAAASAATQSFVSQAERESATLAAAGGLPEQAAAYQKSVVELREVVGFLHNQKEGLECKAELAEQRAAALQEQLASARKEVEELRNSLRSGGEGEAHGSGKVLPAGDYENLLAAVNERNLLRESNQALRQETAAAMARNEKLQASVEQLESSLRPLQSQLQVAEAEREALKEDIRRRAEEVSMWRSRLDAVLSRHDAVDPAVHKALQEQAAALADHVSKLTQQLSDSNAAATTQSEQAATALSAQVAELQSLLEAKQAEVDAESERVVKFRKAVNDFGGKLKAKDKELAQLKETHAKELADVKAAAQVPAPAPAPTPQSNPNPKLVAQLEVLRKQVADSQAATAQAVEAKAAADKAALQAAESFHNQMEALKAQLQQETQKRELLQQQHNALEEKHQRLRTNFTMLKKLFEDQKRVLEQRQAAIEAPAPAVAPAAQAEEPDTETPSAFVPLRPPSTTPPDNEVLQFGAKPALPIPAAAAVDSSAPISQPDADALRMHLLTKRARKPPVIPTQPAPSAPNAVVPIVAEEPDSSKRIAERAARFGTAQTTVAGTKRQRPVEMAAAPGTDAEGDGVGESAVQASESPKAKHARTVEGDAEESPVDVVETHADEAEPEQFGQDPQAEQESTIEPQDDGEVANAEPLESVEELPAEENEGPSAADNDVDAADSSEGEDDNEEEENDDNDEEQPGE
jgi:nucleoprotein TPR